MIRLLVKYRDSGWFQRIRRNLLIRVMLRAYRELRILFYVFQNSLLVHFIQRFKKGSSALEKQKPLSWPADFGYVTSSEQLKQFLKQTNFLFREGGHTIYIPPQPKLALLLGKMVGFYPSDAGFKILKNFLPPDKAIYINGEEFLVKKILTGALTDQVDAANIAYLLEIGPRLYDVTELVTEKVRLTCFVVRHVRGNCPTIEEYLAFIKKLNSYIKEGLLALVPREGLKHDDFNAPDCNHNLLKSANDGKLMYIDFQQFIVRNKRRILEHILTKAQNDLHFGGTRLFRGKKYLYQSVPGTQYVGKRNVQKRWNLIKDLLHKSGIKVRDRIILDIGCNAGMMLHLSLGEGALWALGWDLPDVVRHARQLHLVLGNTRINFTGAKLHEGYPLAKDIPDRLKPWLNESIVFYLSTWQHFGFISDLAKIPWRALVFEGHQDDTFESLADNLTRIQSSWNCVISEGSEIRDGDCGARPLAVLIRS